MPQLPISQHDWALWLFERLEGIQHVGSHWEGVLPQQWDYQEVTDNIPDTLKGMLDAKSRRIEFDPAQGDVFETLEDLVTGPRRRNIPSVFTVRSLHYTHGTAASIPQGVKHYLDAVRFWQLLASFADYEVGQALVFIKTFEAKVEIRAEYGANDLVPLNGLAAFASVYFESEHHRDQKRNIIRASLLEVSKGELVVRLSDLLPKFDDLVERVKASYSLYTADFSFEKLRSEVDKQNVEDMLRLNKTLADIQNQLLALPAALMLAGAGVKDAALATNASIWIGVTVFVWVMWQLVSNQQNSITAIEQEVNLRIDKVKEQPADVASRVLPRFETLRTRVTKQRRVLKNVQRTVVVVWLVATAIVTNAQWPSLAPVTASLLVTSAKWEWNEIASRPFR